MTVESGTWRGERVKESGTTTVRYETRTTIDRPIGDVFARLADVDGYRTWMHRTGLFRRSSRTSDEPLEAGTEYLDATRMGTFHGEITDYQPTSRIGFRETLRWFGTPVMEARPEYFLEADGDRTIVHHVAEGELFGWMRLMKPVAALLARSERGRTVESLRRSLESGSIRNSLPGVAQTGGRGVQGVIVEFRYGDDFDRTRIEGIAREARGRFEGLPELRQKAFTVDEQNRRAINVYLWESEEAGRGFFSDELIERVTGLYGVRPTVTFVEVAEFVDNE